MARRNTARRSQYGAGDHQMVSGLKLDSSNQAARPEEWCRRRRGYNRPNNVESRQARHVRSTSWGCPLQYQELQKAELPRAGQPSSQFFSPDYLPCSFRQINFYRYAPNAASEHMVIICFQEMRKRGAHTRLAELNVAWRAVGYASSDNAPLVPRK